MHALRTRRHGRRRWPVLQGMSGTSRSHSAASSHPLPARMHLCAADPGLLPALARALTKHQRNKHHTLDTTEIRGQRSSFAEKMSVVIGFVHGWYYVCCTCSHDTYNRTSLKSLKNKACQLNRAGHERRNRKQQKVEHKKNIEKSHKLDPNGVCQA